MFNVNVEILSLYENPTINTLAKIINPVNEDKEDNGIVNRQKRGEKRRKVLSRRKKRMTENTF